MVPAWKREGVPGRLLEYAFTEDHVVQGEIMQRREVLRLLAVGAALPVLSPGLAGSSSGSPSPSRLRLQAPHAQSPAKRSGRHHDRLDHSGDRYSWREGCARERIHRRHSHRLGHGDRAAGVSQTASPGSIKQSNELFGKNFVDASVEQQTTLLRAMDDAAMASHSDRRRVRHGNTIPEERDKQLQGNFWDVFKGITVHGYYTSEIGFTQEENLQIIPGAYHGCVPLTAEKKA